MTELRDARVLVTGAASGIGRLMATGAARRGAGIVAWDIDPAGLDKLAEELRAGGAFVRTQVVDVSNREAVYEAANETIDTIGGVDVLILNAGVVDAETILDVDDKTVQKVMDINVMGLFWCTKAFLPGMVERGRGHVVTIASITALVPSPQMIGYTVSKHAAYGFGETLRTELHSLAPSIKTTVVLPFFIKTGMFEGAGTVLFPFFTTHLEPEDVAERVIKAVESNRKRLMLPGFGWSVQILRAFPPTMTDWLSDKLGLLTVMSDFKGRSVSGKHGGGS